MKKDKDTGKGFVSTRRKGFQMTFDNGLMISVQWGAGNYCDNRFPEDLDFSCSKDAKSNTAEVAILTSDDEFIDPADFGMSGGDGEVVGYLTPDEVADLIYKVKNTKV